MRYGYLGYVITALSFFPLCILLKAEEFKPDETIVYKTIGEIKLVLYVFKPDEHNVSNSVPAIVFFHGGGWSGGKPDQFFPHCRHLASRGMLAISAQYRLISQEGVEPRDCLSDAKSAIRFVRRHAKEMGVDPERIASGGGSAEAQLAAACGTTLGFDDPKEDLSISSRPNALVLFNPVFDNGPDGFGHSMVENYWKDFSPLHNIKETTPPTIVMIGTKDEYVPVETVKKYQESMRNAGQRCDVILYEGEPHGFFNYPKDKYMPTLAAMDEFLVSLNFLKRKQ